MAFDYSKALRTTGEGLAKQTAAQTLGIPIVGFDPTSLAVSAGIVVGSWAVNKLLGSLFGSPAPPPVEPMDVQLAGRFQVPYRIGRHRYTGKLLFAGANTEAPRDATERRGQTALAAVAPSWNATALPGIARTETNRLDLVYHLSGDTIDGMDGLYLDNRYYALELRDEADAEADARGGVLYALTGDFPTGPGRSIQLQDYAYLRLYAGYANASVGFGEVVARQHRWERTYVNAAHSFAVVTLLAQEGEGGEPVFDRIPAIEFVGTGIRLPDPSQYDPSNMVNPFPVARYTNNLAAVVYWVLTQWPDGPRRPVSELDLRSFVEAYVTAGTVVQNTYGSDREEKYAQGWPGESKRYTFDGTIRAGEDWSRILADLEALGLGSVYPHNGRIRLVLGKNTRRDSDARELNAADATEPPQYTTQPRVEERFNAVAIKQQQSMVNQYQESPPYTLESTEAQAIEGGDRIVREVTFRGITDPATATRLAANLLGMRNNRNPTIQTQSAHPAWRAVQEGAGLFWTDAKHNLDRLEVLCTRKVVNMDGSVVLTLKADPSNSFHDNQGAPPISPVGVRQARPEAVREVTITAEFTDVHDVRTMRARVEVVLPGGYDAILVDWYKADERLLPRELRRIPVRRGDTRVVFFIDSIAPNTDYVGLFRTATTVRGRDIGSPPEHVAWNSGDDTNAMAAPTSVVATGSVGGVFTEWDGVFLDANPYYWRTEVQIFVGSETTPRHTGYASGNSYLYSGLPTDEQLTVHVDVRHQTKSGVLSPVTSSGDVMTATAAASAAGFLGLNVFAVQMNYNNFQSVAGIDANGEWGLSKAQSWENLKTLAASDTLYLYEADKDGHLQRIEKRDGTQQHYFETLETGDYITAYLSETQAVSFSLSAPPVRTNVGTVQSPRYRYAFRLVALSGTVQESPVPTLQSGTEIGFRFSRAIQGADGRDGMGFEYIFCRNNDESLPASQHPDNAWGFDSPGTRGGKTWQDGAVGLTAAEPVLFQSQRRVDAGVARGGAVAAPWTTPAVVGRLGVDGAASQRGEDGRGLEAVYRVSATIARPATPSNTRPYDQNNWNSDGWYDAAPTLTAQNPYLWVSRRQVPGLPAAGTAPTTSGTGAWGGWTTPTVNGRYGVDGSQGGKGDPGERGRAGEDGNGIEIIFQRTRTSTPLSRPSNNRPYDVDNWNSDGWYDAAGQLNPTFQYLWQCERAVPGLPAVNTTPASTWGNWTAPRITGRWGRGTPGDAGPQGPKGDDGDDGAGIEYIFTVYSSATLPSSRYPNNTWGYDRPGQRGGQRWEDAAPNTTATNPYLFVSQRNITGSPRVGASVSANWTTPRVVGHFGAQGEDGVPGEDGVAYEFIFKRWLQGVGVDAPSNSWGYERPQNNWRDDPPSLNAGYSNLYMARRVVTGTPTPGASVSATWSTPAIIGHYQDGAAIAKGQGDRIWGNGNVETLSTAPTSRQDFGPYQGRGIGIFRQYYTVGATLAQLEGRAARPLPTAAGTSGVQQWSNERLGVTASRPYEYVCDRGLLAPEQALSGVTGADLIDGRRFYWIFHRLSSSATPALAKTVRV